MYQAGLTPFFRVLVVCCFFCFAQTMQAQDVPAPQPSSTPPSTAPAQPAAPTPAANPETGSSTPGTVVEGIDAPVVKRKPRKKVAIDSLALADSLARLSLATVATPAAQTVLPGNPFDLVFRLSPEALIARSAVIDSSASDTSGIAGGVAGIVATTENPFEVKTTSTGKPSKPIIGSRQFKPLVLVREKSLPLMALIITMLGFLALAISLNRQAVSAMYSSLLNDSAMRITFKEQTSFNRSPYYLLYLAFLVNASVFVYLMVLNYQLPVGESHLQVLGMCATFVTVVFVGKLLLLRFLGWALPLDKEFRFYRFVIVTFSILMGLAMAGGNLFIAFSEPVPAAFALKVTLIILGVLLIIRTIRSLFLVGSAIGSHILHFLLYLCAVELAPLAIILKLLLTK